MAAQGFVFDVRSDTKRIVAEIRADMDKVTQAQARALNRTGDQVRTEAGREIRAVYNVTLRGIRQASTVKKTSTRAKYPRVEVIFSGLPINLVEFGARARNPWNVPGRRHNRRGGGIAVQVKHGGSKKLIAGGFLATLKSGPNAGRLGAFRRVGKARYPIHFLPSISIPQMVEQQAVSKAVLKFAGEAYEKNLEQQLIYLMGR